MCSPPRGDRPHSPPALREPGHRFRSHRAVAQLGAPERFPVWGLCRGEQTVPREGVWAQPLRPHYRREASNPTHWCPTHWCPIRPCPTHRHQELWVARVLWVAWVLSVGQVLPVGQEVSRWLKHCYLPR